MESVVDEDEVDEGGEDTVQLVRSSALLHPMIARGPWLAHSPILISKMILVSWLGSRVRQTDWFVVEKDR